MRQVFCMVHQEARIRAAEAVYMAREGSQVVISDKTRNTEQNALMWLWLTAFSKQLQWPVNGQLTYLQPDDWKNILSAAFRQESVRLAQGLDGGVIMLGCRTSQMGKREFAEFVTFIEAIAADKEVYLDPLEEISAVSQRAGLYDPDTGSVQP